jgi:hypothetical protein
VSTLLIHFGSAAQFEWSGSDRRIQARYHFDKEPSVTFLAKPSFRHNRASVRNISNEGIALASTQRFAPGTRIAIRMPTPDPLLAGFHVADVCYYTPTTGGWLLGCRFVRDLASQELLAWVKNITIEERAAQAAAAQ